MTTNITVEPTILTREYKAPRQLVFDAWTQPEHLKNWHVSRSKDLPVSSSLPISNRGLLAS